MALMETIFVCIGSGYMVAILPYFGYILYKIQWFYMPTARQLTLMELEAKSPMVKHVTETVEGLSTIRAFGWQEQYQDLAIQCIDSSQRPNYLLACMQCWLAVALNLLVAAIGTLVVALATMIPSSSGGGFIGIALTSVLSLSGALSGILPSWTTVEIQVGAVSRIQFFEKETPSEDDDEKDSVEPDSSWPTGHLEVSDLTVVFEFVTTSYYR
jgi:ATP-binding cassette subfamily C (CFTR/MRP) protein 1